MYSGRRINGGILWELYLGECIQGGVFRKAYSGRGTLESAETNFQIYDYLFQLIKPGLGVTGIIVSRV